MNPSLVIHGAPTAVAADKLSSVGPKGSFAEHLERKVAEASRAASNKLGLGENEPPPAGAVKRALRRPGQENEESGAPTTVVEMLEQVMRDLRAQAKEIKQGPGEWSFAPVETAALRKFAGQAGMNETEISWLLPQRDIQGGKVKVADFLASLQQYFSRLAQAEPITVPETDLPLIETFLSKMGLSVEESNRIAKAAASGGGGLDLGLLLQSLQATSPATVEALTAIPLTPWESEQLQLLLAKAGLPRSYQESLLATAALNLPTAEAGRPSADAALLASARQGATELDFSGLCAMLASRMKELKGSRTVADLPGFLGELKQVLQHAGFEEKTVGWAPVVQNTAQAVYDELNRLVAASTTGADAAASRLAEQLAQLDKIVAAGENGRQRAVVIREVALLDAGRLQEQLGEQLRGLQVNQALAVRQGAVGKKLGQEPVALVVEAWPRTTSEAAAPVTQAESTPGGGEKQALFGAMAQELQNGVGGAAERTGASRNPGAEKNIPGFAPVAATAAPPLLPAESGAAPGQGEGEPGQRPHAPVAAERKTSIDPADFAQVGPDRRAEGQELPASAQGGGNILPVIAGEGETGSAGPLAGRTPSEFERQVFNQISEGVKRGLKNDDHHLVLTLYPKDLGEVKVEMKVRDHQVAVSFIMENNKVKEALESHLGDFKDNLQKQGYSLGEYSVTVNREDGGHDARQRFEFAWQEQMRGSRNRPAPPADELPYPVAGAPPWRRPEGNVNLVV